MHISGTEPSEDCLLSLHLLELCIGAREWKSSIQIGGWSYIERRCIRNRSGVGRAEREVVSRKDGVGRQEWALSVVASGIQRGYSRC